MLTKQKYSMKNQFYLFLTSLILALSQHGIALAASTSFGLLPYLSPQKLIQVYTPLKQAMEQELDVDIRFLSAPNFAEYVRRAETLRYDFYLTAPHFASFVAKQYNYKPLVQVKQLISGVIIVPVNSTYQIISDLKGATLYTPDPLAIVSILGSELLLQHELINNQTIFLKQSFSHNNAILGIINNKADGAIVAKGVFNTMPNSIRNQLRVLGETKQVPSLTVLVSPNIPLEQCRQVKALLLKFHHSMKGKRFFSRTGFREFIEVDANGFDQLDIYAKRVESSFTQKAVVLE